MNLLRGKIWAFPLTIGVLSIIAIYELYRFAIHFSWALLLLLVIDTIVITLTWVEYRSRLRRSQAVS